MCTLIFKTFLLDLWIQCTWWDNKHWKGQNLPFLTCDPLTFCILGGSLGEPAWALALPVPFPREEGTLGSFPYLSLWFLVGKSGTVFHICLLYRIIVRIKWDNGMKCFIRCDIHGKAITRCVCHVHSFSFLLPPLFRAFCCLNHGLCLFSTDMTPHLWLLQDVLSSPEIVLGMRWFPYPDVWAASPVCFSGCSVLTPLPPTRFAEPAAHALCPWVPLRVFLLLLLRIRPPFEPHFVSSINPICQVPAQIWFSTFIFPTFLDPTCLL